MLVSKTDTVSECPEDVSDAVDGGGHPCCGFPRVSPSPRQGGDIRRGPHGRGGGAICVRPRGYEPRGERRGKLCVEGTVEFSSLLRAGWEDSKGCVSTSGTGVVTSAGGERLRLPGTHQ